MDLSTLMLLCVFAFTAGLVDAIAGGGGLIQTPAALVLLPQYPVATIIATIKLPSFTGTGLAIGQYIRRVRLHFPTAVLMCITAFGAAFAGSALLTMVSSRFMKPVIFFILAGVAVYTYTKKNFGEHTTKPYSRKKQLWYAFLISLVIGFYDGFIGPGAGSFLILAFIALLGYDFLHASANAKLVNMATNSGSIALFLLKGTILWSVALPMAVCNGLGGIIGARLAIAKGNHFIRLFFLCIVTATLLRLAYDVFVKN
ncbi:sulfite exporter TauE/SafE family protein [Sediminibacterium soli]|uniref:sulfite exporter TauE/SafE family protein n=1 Tax=Sediminibacterium soli TaxID=2698829 RepID=UPI001379CD7E|nr:TSUP family transporter [Sediminibacterium soli]NCI46036.1 TSUP family transporter [Sediminibacterium soli]